MVFYKLVCCHFSLEPLRSIVLQLLDHFIHIIFHTSHIIIGILFDIRVSFKIELNTIFVTSYYLQDYEDRFITDVKYYQYLQGSESLIHSKLTSKKYWNLNVFHRFFLSLISNIWSIYFFCYCFLWLFIWAIFAIRLIP